MPDLAGPPPRAAVAVPVEVGRLRLAYAHLLQVADAVVEAGGGTAPPGEWTSSELLAHLVSVDAGVAAAACAVVAGAPAAFDNRVSLDPANLGRIAGGTSDLARLRRRVGAQGEVVCALAEQLREDELAAPVPTVLVDGTTLVLDGPVALGDLIRGLAEDHLPRHAAQLDRLLH